MFNWEQQGTQVTRPGYTYRYVKEKKISHFSLQTLSCTSVQTTNVLVQYPLNFFFYTCPWPSLGLSEICFLSQPVWLVFNSDIKLHQNTKWNALGCFINMNKCTSACSVECTGTCEDLLCSKFDVRRSESDNILSSQGHETKQINWAHSKKSRIYRIWFIDVCAFHSPVMWMFCLARWVSLVALTASRYTHTLISLWEPQAWLFIKKPCSHTAWELI